MRAVTHTGNLRFSKLTILYAEGKELQTLLHPHPQSSLSVKAR